MSESQVHQSFLSHDRAKAGFYATYLYDCASTDSPSLSPTKSYPRTHSRSCAVTPVDFDDNLVHQTMDSRHDLTTADIAAGVNARYGNCAIDATGDGHQYEAHTEIATAFGYKQEELKAIPDRANLGLSCGNPVALANLKEVSFEYVSRKPLFTTVH